MKSPEPSYRDCGDGKPIEGPRYSSKDGKDWLCGRHNEQEQKLAKV